ncbi:MAG: hypothetical protein V8Q37_06500 [Angelakisella sp.]
MAETFKLPCSSYEELIKLFQAYANTKEGTALSLDEITQATGVPRTIVSKNNGFMVQVGLITEGNKKAATETGRALGRAYTSKITDEVERIWKEIIAEVDFLNRMLSAVEFVMAWIVRVSLITLFILQDSKMLRNLAQELEH